MKAGDGENRATGVAGGVYSYGPDGSRLKKTTTTASTLYLGDDIELAGGVWTKYLTAEAKRVGPTPGSSVTSWMPSFVSRLRAGATISPASAW